MVTSYLNLALLKLDLNFFCFQIPIIDRFQFSIDLIENRLTYLDRNKRGLQSIGLMNIALIDIKFVIGQKPL